MSAAAPSQPLSYSDRTAPAAPYHAMTPETSTSGTAPAAPAAATPGLPASSDHSPALGSEQHASTLHDGAAAGSSGGHEAEPSPDDAPSAAASSGDPEAPAAAADTPAPRACCQAHLQSPASSSTLPPASDTRKRKSGKAPFVPLLILASLAVPAVALLRRYLRKLPSSQQQQPQGRRQPRAAPAKPSPPPPASDPPLPDTLPILLSTPAILHPPTSSPGPRPLASLNLIASEDIDVQNTPTTHAIPSLPPLPPAPASAPVLARLVAAGATCIAKSSNQPLPHTLTTDLLGANVGSPLNRYRCAGGGCTGAAVAVATGLADLALCTDTAGEARVPASCCGLFALRPSAGALTPGKAPGSAGGAAAVLGQAVLAREPAVLLKAAQALLLPGSANLSGEIIKFVVAQDLFDLCAPELQPATLAVKRAIINWAGAEQAGAVQLVKFLATNTQAWQGLAGPEQAGAGEGLRLSGFVEAAAAAVQALGAEELWQSLGAEEREALAAAAPLAAAQADEAEGEEGAEEAAPPPPSPRPSPERLKAAAAMLAEVSALLRQTVKADTVMVLPSLPFPPPLRAPPSPAAPGPTPTEREVFTKLVRCFHSIPTLAGCPVVTCPVGQLRDGSPVSVSLFGVQRNDQRLVAVAQKLVPMIRDSFLAVKEEISAMAASERGAAGGVAASGGASAPQANGKPAGGVATAAAAAAAAAAPAADPKRLEKAERFKAKGNAFYSAAKYADAVTEYTKAINTHPHCAVYFNNRAMACIKLFRFEQAEEDCCRVLGFPDLSDRDRVKALLRRATARDALQRHDDAERDLKEVLRLEPGHQQAKEDLAQLRKHKAGMGQAQAAMIQSMRLQQQQQAGGAGGGKGAAAAMAAMAGMLPPGFDPSMLPPGFDPSTMLPPGFDPSTMLPPGVDPAQLGYDYDYEYEGGAGGQ